MAHTLLYILGYNAPEDALLPPDWDWSDPGRLDQALKTLTDALRPWTIDFHVAQNDATVKGAGTHDKTGHHCLPNDPNGKLTIAHHAGFWLRGDDGTPSKAFRHVCWDGCMFPNAIMAEQNTWNDILAAMIAVRDEHGWSDTESLPAEPVVETAAELETLVKEELTEPAPKPVAAQATPKRRPAAKRAKTPKTVKPAKRSTPKRPKAKAKPAKSRPKKPSPKAKLKRLKVVRKPVRPKKRAVSTKAKRTISKKSSQRRKKR
jgi:hypothetical protein